jgi:hypothetical protein
VHSLFKQPVGETHHMSKPGLLIPTGRRSSYGFFSLFTQTLILAAGVAAETASAGHLIGVRNSKAAEFHVTFARLKLFTRTAPSAAQLYGVSLKKLTGYSAAHTGGGTGGANAALVARDVAFASRAAASGLDGSGVVARVAGDAALTAGTQTIGGTFMALEQHELIAAATVQLGNRERILKSHDRHPIFILKNTEGVIVTNNILTANSLAYSVGLELGGYLVG